MKISKRQTKALIFELSIRYFRNFYFNTR